MKLFIDTGNIKDIEKLCDLGIIDGVTTNPTLLAKVITTLDVISGGRAVLGLGAGWFELEHQQLGFEFDTFTERFEKLEEALQIITSIMRARSSVSSKAISPSRFSAFVVAIRSAIG